MGNKSDILKRAADVVSAYVGNNKIEADALPALIRAVYQTFAQEMNCGVPNTGPTPIPAIPIEQSITDDYLICLEDGKRYKSLKRHLRTKYELTPKAYREKWGLPADYPMVAPNYSVERSRLAKRTGLGKS